MTKLDEKIGKMEAQIESIGCKLDELMNNHLIHISADIKELNAEVIKLKIRMALWAGGLIVISWGLEHFLK